VTDPGAYIEYARWRSGPGIAPPGSWDELNRRAHPDLIPLVSPCRNAASYITGDLFLHDNER